MTRYDASPYADQKIIAPPKLQFLEKKIGPENFRKKKKPKKKIQRRKMKNCKSSETCFAEVSRRSELCSGGKRPFEVSKKNRNSRVGVRKGNVAQELHRFGAVLVLRYRLYGYAN